MDPDKAKREIKTSNTLKAMPSIILFIGIFIAMFLWLHSEAELKTTIKANTILPKDDWACTEYNQDRYINKTLFDQYRCRLENATETAKKLGINNPNMKVSGTAIICSNGNVEDIFIWQNGTTCTQHTINNKWQTGDQWGTNFK